MRGLLAELGLHQPSSTTIINDNLQAVALFNVERSGQASTEIMRELSTTYHFVASNVQLGNLKVAFTPTDEMVADILTKATNLQTFTRLRDYILNDPI